jgi:hypothetical protein
MTRKILLSSLATSLTQPIVLFIGMASFESRCTTLLQEFVRSKICNDFCFFTNLQAGKDAAKNLQTMQQLVEDNASTTSLDLDSPTLAASAFLKAIDSTRALEDGAIFVDTTTFTHEQLLILFRVLTEAKLSRLVIFGYTGADAYSTNTELKNAWLSKGVSQIRSVLGFPGNLLPSKRLHLIVLVGFEHERAKTVIERFEPNVLTLGIGKRDESVSERHHATNTHFFEEVKRFVELKASISTDVRTFEFSCVDPLAAHQSVLDQVALSPDHNTVICPMNTKLSTLGVALAATQNESIQICYSRAIEYNEDGYSTPSKQITLFEKLF